MSSNSFSSDSWEARANQIANDNNADEFPFADWEAEVQQLDARVSGEVEDMPLEARINDIQRRSANLETRLLGEAQLRRQPYQPSNDGQSDGLNIANIDTQSMSMENSTIGSGPNNKKKTKIQHQNNEEKQPLLMNVEPHSDGWDLTTVNNAPRLDGWDDVTTNNNTTQPTNNNPTQTQPVHGSTYNRVRTEGRGECFVDTIRKGLIVHRKDASDIRNRYQQWLNDNLNTDVGGQTVKTMIKAHISGLDAENKTLYQGEAHANLKHSVVKNVQDYINRIGEKGEYMNQVDFVLAGRCFGINFHIVTHDTENLPDRPYMTHHGQLLKKRMVVYYPHGNIVYDPSKPYVYVYYMGDHYELLVPTDNVCPSQLQVIGLAEFVDKEQLKDQSLSSSPSHNIDDTTNTKGESTTKSKKTIMSKALSSMSGTISTLSNGAKTMSKGVSKAASNVASQLNCLKKDAAPPEPQDDASEDDQDSSYDPEDDDNDFMLEDGEEVEIDGSYISLIPIAHDMSPRQLNGYKKILDICVEYVLDLAKNGNGALALPFGGLWDGIVQDKMPQLWNSGEKASVYLYLIKIGMTLSSVRRFELDKEYSSTSTPPTIPVLFDLDTLPPHSLKLVNNHVDKLIKEYGTFPNGKDYTNITIQEVIDFSREKCIPMGLCLALHIVRLLPDNEPVSFRKRLAALMAESGIQELLKRRHKPIDERSAQHEWFTKDNTDEGGQLYKRAAEAADSLVASLDLTPDEVSYIRVNSIQTTAILTYPGDTVGHEVGLMEEEEWSQFPPCKPLLTSHIIRSKNTVGNISMVNIVTITPPGGTYDAESYIDETLKSGFFDIYLPQLQNFIDCDDKVAVKLVNYFKVMWKYVKKIDWFKKISKTPKWKQIMSHSDANSLVDGLNDVQWLMYLGFKPVSRVKGHVVTLTLRKEGKLRIVHAHCSFCWSLYAGLDLKKSDLNPQSMRTEVATTITLFSQMMSEENSSLVTEKDWGKLPVFGNSAVGQATRNWSLVAMHGSQQLSTFLAKAIAVSFKVLLMHRQGYRSQAPCSIFATSLREYESRYGTSRVSGKAGKAINDKNFKKAFVRNVASASFLLNSDMEAVNDAFQKLRKQRYDENNIDEVTYYALSQRVEVILKSDLINDNVKRLLEKVWYDFRCEKFGVRDPNNYIEYDGYTFHYDYKLQDGTKVYRCYSSRWNGCKKTVYELPNGTITEKGGRFRVAQPHKKSCTKDGTKPKGYKDESLPERPKNFKHNGYKFIRNSGPTKKHQVYDCACKLAHKKHKDITNKCTAKVTWPHFEGYGTSGKVAGENAQKFSGKHDPIHCKPDSQVKGTKRKKAEKKKK